MRLRILLAAALAALPASHSSAAAADPRLPEAVYSQDETERTKAIEQLRRDPNKSLPQLLHAIHDDNPKRRAAAGEALVAVAPAGGAQAADLIFESLDKWGGGAHYREQALARIGRPALPGILKREGWQSHVLALVSKGDVEAAGLIVAKAMEEGDELSDEEADSIADEQARHGFVLFQQPFAERALQIIGVEESAAVLIAALEKKPSSETAATLLARLARPGMASLVPPLMKQIAAGPERRQHSATLALGVIGAPAVPALIKALEQPQSRPWAIYALAIAGEEAAPARHALAALAASKEAVTSNWFTEYFYIPADELTANQITTVGHLARRALSQIGRQSAEVLPASVIEGKSPTERLASASDWAQAVPGWRPALDELAAAYSAEATSARIDTACIELAKDENFKDSTPEKIREYATYQDLKLRAKLIEPWSRSANDDPRFVARFFEILRLGNMATEEPGCFGPWPFLADLTRVAVGIPKPLKPKLLEMLKEKGDDRAKAFYVLANMGRDAPELEEHVWKALVGESVLMQRGALIWLARRGDASPRALDAIAQACQRNWEERDEAKRALCELGPRAQSVAPILMRDWKPSDEVGWDDERMTARALALLAPADEACVRAFLDSLLDEDNTNKHAAAYALGKTAAAPKEALPRLELVLRRSRDYPYATSIDFMHSQSFANSNSADAAFPEFENGANERILLAWCIGRYGPAAAGQAKALLGQATKKIETDRIGDDEESELQSGYESLEALIALARIGPAAAGILPDLREALANTKPDHNYMDPRFAAAIAIYRIGGRDDDLRTVRDEFKFVHPWQITPSIAEEIAQLAKKHKDFLPRLEALLDIELREYLSQGIARTQNARWAWANPSTIDRVLSLATAVEAIDPASRPVRDAVDALLAAHVSGRHNDLADMPQAVKAAARFPDPSPHRRALLEKASKDGPHGPRPAQVRWAAENALAKQK